MSQKDVADRYKLSATSVSRWEISSEARYDVLIDLADLFRVSIDDLLRKDLKATQYKLGETEPLQLEEPGVTTLLTKEDMEALKTMQDDLKQQSTMMLKMINELERLKQQVEQQAMEIKALKEKG